MSLKSGRSGDCLRASVMPFTGTVNKFRFGQVIEVLKITGFFYCILQNPELFWQLAKTPRDLMRLPSCCTDNISMNGCVLGRYTQNRSASPPRGLRVIGTGLQWPVWGHGMMAVHQETRKNKSLGWEIWSVGAVDEEKKLKIKEEGRLWAKMWWRHHFKGKSAQRNRTRCTSPLNVQFTQGMTFF